MTGSSFNEEDAALPLAWPGVHIMSAWGLDTDVWIARFPCSDSVPDQPLVMLRAGCGSFSLQTYLDAAAAQTLIDGLTEWVTSTRADSGGQ